MEITCQVFYNNAQIFIFISKQKSPKQNKTVSADCNNAHYPIRIPKYRFKKQLIDGRNA